MKNHKKIFILFMFLFIYFIMPRDVFAATINKTCKCNGSKFSGELNLSSDTKGNNQEVGWIFADNGKPDGWNNLTGNGVRPGNNKYSSSYPNNFNFAPTNANGEVRSLVCPAQIVVTKANVYLYGSNQVSTNEPANFQKTMPNNSDLLTCVLENSQNSVVENNDAATSTQEWTDATTQNNDKENTRKRKEKILKVKKSGVDVGSQSKQNCEGVFGKADGSQGQTVAWLLQKIFNYIRIFGIFLTIVLSAFDFTKSVISNDFDSLKKSQMRLVYRIIGIVALLLLPLLVNFLLGLFISGSITDFSCGIY